MQKILIAIITMWCFLSVGFAGLESDLHQKKKCFAYPGKLESMPKKVCVHKLKALGRKGKIIQIEASVDGQKVVANLEQRRTVVNDHYYSYQASPSADWIRKSFKTGYFWEKDIPENKGCAYKANFSLRVVHDRHLGVNKIVGEQFINQNTCESSPQFAVVTYKEVKS
jgi:hypothetical protein